MRWGRGRGPQDRDRLRNLIQEDLDDDRALLVGLDGVHVLEVVATEECLRVRVESPPGRWGARRVASSF